MNYNDIWNNIQKKQSFLCVGLDSDIAKIPQHLLREEDPIFAFNKAIVDATASYCVSYKPNTAFYESLGAKGWLSLQKTAEYIKTNYPDIFLIADCKRGDIGNTCKMYAKTFFEQMPFDAVTVAPYMGRDSVAPFLEYTGKWAIILALTSNPSAADFQYLKDSSCDNLIYEKTLQYGKQWGSEQNIMYVCGATKADKFESIRKIVPKNFLLVPGVGAQGGSLEDVAKYGMNDNCGLLVNSSRGIIYASNDHDFAEASGQKAQELQQQMAGLLSRC